MTWKEWFWETGFNFEDRLAQADLMALLHRCGITTTWLKVVNLER